MSLPKQTITVLDPGIGLVSASPDAPLYLGYSVGGSGSANVLYSFSRPNDIRGTLGFGELAEDVSKALQQRGGPVLAMLTAGSVGASSSSVSGPTGAGAAAGVGGLTITGTPRGKYAGRVEITKAGINGVAEFKYTLDYFDPDKVSPTWSPIRVVPAGGTFVAGDSGLSFVFDDTGSAPGDISFTLGAVFTFTTSPAKANSTDLGTAAAALLALTQVQFPLIVLAQTSLLETDASGLAAALSGHLTSFSTGFRYARGIVDAGSGDTSANVLAEAANWQSRRINPWYGHAISTVSLPYEGFSVRQSGCYSSAAARAARELISTDLARYASGSLEDVRQISFDGFNDETLDAAGIGTLRTWPGVSGYYVAKARLKSPLGSDFTDIHFGRIMDVACRTVYEAQLPFIAEGFRTTSTGAIDPLEKADVETVVNRALTDKLMRPRNARGRPGHVSAVRYTVDPVHNLNTTGQILSTIAIRPLGYANEIVTQIGYSLNVE
jgi:hypothetical protein